MPPNGAQIHHVDVIICDVNVLVFDGQLLLDWVINTPSIVEIPVIVLTSNLPSQGLERLIRRGAWDVLHKPLNRAVFLNAIATVFATRRQKLFIERLRAKGDEYKEKFMKGQHGKLRLSNMATSNGGTPSAPSSPYRLVPTGVNFQYPAPLMHNSSSSSSLLATPLVLTPTNAQFQQQQQQHHHHHHHQLQPHSSSSPPPPASSQSQVHLIQILLIERDDAAAAQLTEWISSDFVSIRHVHSVTDALPILRESQRLAAMAVAAATQGLNHVSPSTQYNSLSLLQQQALIRTTSNGERLGETTPRATVSSMNGGAGVTGPGAASAAAVAARAIGLGLPHSYSASTTPTSPMRSINPSRATSSLARYQPSMPTASFGVELILIGHDSLVPSDCMNEDLSALGAGDGPHDHMLTNRDSSDLDDADLSVTHPPMMSPSPVAGLAASQQLIDLSLQPVWGKARRLPIVVVCDEDGPSPIAMAILKHVALTIVNAPLSFGVVNKKMSLILDLIEQNRQSILYARRAHIYKGLLSNLVNSNANVPTNSLPSGVGLNFDDADDFPLPPHTPNGKRGTNWLASAERRASPKHSPPAGFNFPGSTVTVTHSPRANTSAAPESGSLLMRSRQLNVDLQPLPIDLPQHSPTSLVPPAVPFSSLTPTGVDPSSPNSSSISASTSFHAPSASLGSIHVSSPTLGSLGSAKPLVFSSRALSSSNDSERAAQQSSTNSANKRAVLRIRTDLDEPNQSRPQYGTP